MKEYNIVLSATKATYVWIIIAVVVLLQSAAPVAYSATNNNDFNQLIEKSDAIIFGRCIAVSSEWRKNKIYSHASFQVEDNIKGTVPAVIKIEYLGGTAIHPVLNTPVAMNVSNGISFVVGDEAVLMLDKISNGIFRVHGAAQGIAPVMLDESRGEKVIQSGASKIQSTPSAKDDSVVLSGRPMSLAEFKEFIRTRLLNEKERTKQ